MGFDPWTIGIELGLTVGLGAVQRWLGDPPPDDRKGVFSSYPATAEGTPVPIVYGRIRVRQPIVAWYGISRKRALATIEGLGNDTPFGENELGERLHYGLSMLFVVGVPCGPIGVPTGARLLAIFDGDTKYEMNLGHLDTLQLFGGLGVLGAPPTIVTPYHGTLQFFSGNSDQLISDNAAIHPLIPADQEPDITEIGRFMKWASRLGNTPITVKSEEIPGYRNQMLVAFTGDHSVPIAGGDDDSFEGPTLDAFYFGPSDTIPRLSVECRHVRLDDSTEPA
jgi:hypothetical protein